MEVTSNHSQGGLFMLSNKNNKLVFHKLIAEMGGSFVKHTIKKFNGEFPEKINIVKGKVNDRKCIDDLFEHNSCIYVFDRGYYDYKWYDELSKKEIKFVTRATKHSIVMEERMISSDLSKDIYDTEVIMGTSYSKNLTTKSYREIMTFNEEGEPVTFITNIFDLPASDIIKIYKHRWEIELFFKWIKQNLKIKKLIGYNENAVRIQVFSALISYMLIYLCSGVTALKRSMLTLTRIIRSNLLEDFDEYTVGYFRIS